MKMVVYSVFDVATGAYMRPFFLQSDNQAMRTFCDACIDPQNEIAKHPPDRDWETTIFT